MPTGDAWPVAWRPRRRYLPWRARDRPGGGVSKVPHGPVQGRWQPVDPLQSGHWLTYDEAGTVVQAGEADGIGLAVTPALRLTVIDLDACLATGGQLDERAQTVLDAFPGAYVEVSPSGWGLHVVLRAACGTGWRRQAGVELIDRGFVTVTGRAFQPVHTPLPDHTAALRAWHAARQPPGTPSPAPGLQLAVPASDAALIQRAHNARNGARFAALWAGEAAGYATASEADLALLLMLDFWAGPGATDADLDRLFRQSGRYRPKWGSGAPLSPYAGRTLATVRAYRPAVLLSR